MNAPGGQLREGSKGANLSRLTIDRQSALLEKMFYVILVWTAFLSISISTRKEAKVIYTILHAVTTLEALEFANEGFEVFVKGSLFHPGYDGAIVFKEIDHAQEWIAKKGHRYPGAGIFALDIGWSPGASVDRLPIGETVSFLRVDARVSIIEKHPYFAYSTGFKEKPKVEENESAYTDEGGLDFGFNPFGSNATESPFSEAFFGAPKIPLSGRHAPFSASRALDSSKIIEEKLREYRSKILSEKISRILLEHMGDEEHVVVVLEEIPLSDGDLIRLEGPEESINITSKATHEMMLSYLDREALERIRFITDSEEAKGIIETVLPDIILEVMGAALKRGVIQALEGSLTK